MPFRVEALPPDVLALLLRFLTGFDLLPLSHASRRFYHDLLTANSAAWASRLPSKSFAGRTHSRPQKREKKWKAKYKKLVGEVKTVVRSAREPSSHGHQRSWKEVYFTSTSLRFPGCAEGLVVERQVGGAVKLWDGLHHVWNADAFSFDLWFAMLPSKDTMYQGGVLLGAQATEWPGVRWGDDCQQFVHVDRDGNLFCSMAAEKAVVATGLEVNKWYHLTLSFDRFPDDWWRATQRVYLDGEMVHETEGTVHPRWRFLNYAQLGSGIIDGDSPGSPSPQYRAWYGFHGLIDAFRFWNGVLTADHAQLLVEGQEAAVEAQVDCAWSLKRDEELEFYGEKVTRVKSTRPREHLCCRP